MPTRKLVTRYRDDLAIFPDMWHKFGLVLGVALALTYPFLVDDRWLIIGNLALVAVVGSISLMVLTGFAGQISLGHAGLLAVGAYAAAILGMRYHLPFWLILPVAGLLATAVGLAVGVFALRLEGLYLAIVTIGLLYLVRHMLLAMPDLTGGIAGIEVPIYLLFGENEADAASRYDAVHIGPLTFEFGHKLYFGFLIVATAVAWMVKNLARSDHGRAMMAVRDHDLAAAVLGVNPARAKILSFAISSFLAGVAGAMLAAQQQYITVDPFHLDMSIAYIAMIILGGVGTVFGAVAGAIAFTFLTPAAEWLGGLLIGWLAPKLPFLDLDQLSSAQQSTVLFSILLCVILVVEPLGLLGLWLRIKRYFMAWPFRY
ncbi:MAG: branched-chain amino acid ABC transporter permease [Myxococcota bacterium]